MGSSVELAHTLPAVYNASAIPIPPFVINDPVVGDVDAVVSSTKTVDLLMGGWGGRYFR